MKYAIKAGKLWFASVSPSVYAEKDKRPEAKERIEHYSKFMKRKYRKSQKRVGRLKDYLAELKKQYKNLPKEPKVHVDFSVPVHRFVESVDDAKKFKSKKQAEKAVLHLVKKYGKISSDFKIVTLEKD